MGAPPTVVVVAGGDAPTPQDLIGIGADAVVIGADSGVAHARRLGLRVKLAVGDFDSVSPDELAKAVGEGAELRRYPAAKDATDLEIALDAAREYEPDRVVVLGAYGGRLDHQLANVLLLSSPEYADLRLQARGGGQIATVIRDSERLHGAIGMLISLLPMHGPAQGVTTTGLRYPLRGENLPAGTSRGVSNEFAGSNAHVTLTSGALLAIQPRS